MSGLRSTSWHKLPMSLKELSIDITLRCGQSFRWKKSPSTGHWSCALNGRIVTLNQDDTHLHYCAHFPISSPSTSTPTSRMTSRRKAPAKTPLTPPPSTPASQASNDQDTPSNPEEFDDTAHLLHSYLNLTPNLTSLYQTWSAADPNFARKAPLFTGIRILRQSAWEALVSFICSSNNNISRITLMIDRLCEKYGDFLGKVEGREWFDFPGPERLTGRGVEGELRDLGFGYRARYLGETARVMSEKGLEWLEGLRNMPESAGGEEEELPVGGREGYRRAHEALLELQGVGPKVADCICLMGLGWGEAVPVDTHGTFHPIPLLC